MNSIRFDSSTNARLNQWIKDSFSYAILKKRVENDELANLLPGEKKFLLDFLVRNEIMHEAVKNGDTDFILALLACGADLNALNAERRSPLTFASTPELFCTLVKKGAQWILPEKKSLVGYLILKHGQKKEEPFSWMDALVEITPLLRQEEWLGLSSKEVKEFSSYLLGDPNFAGTILKIAPHFIDQHPEEVIRLAEITLGTAACGDYKAIFLALVRHQILPSQLIEKIITNKKVLYWLLPNIFFEELDQLWQPEGSLKDHYLVHQDLRLALLLHLIAESNLSTITHFLIRYSSFTGTQDQKIKKQIIERIDWLQKEEKTTIWQRLSEAQYNELAVSSLLQLGCDPNWLNSSGQNLLYTKNIWVLEFWQGEFPFNIQQMDVLGLNALEHHCQQPDVEFFDLKMLVDLGLKITAAIPMWNTCQYFFPQSPLLQALLAALLSNTRRDLYKNFAINLTEKELEDFNSAIKNIPLLEKFANSILSETNFPTRLEFKSVREVLSLNEEAFENPLLLREMTKKNLVARKIFIRSGGGIDSTFADFVMQMIEPLDDLKHMKKRDFPKTHRRVLKAFQKAVAPVVIENISEHWEGDKLEVLGRTLINTDRKEAFKLLKPKENLRSFCQEFGVTTAFLAISEQFKSQFHSPLGLYILKEVPQFLEKYAMRPTTEDRVIIYHYQASLDVFKYIQELDWELYLNARATALHDQAKMVRMGIYPDSLYHARAEGRRYILFSALLQQLMKKYGGFSLSDEGGAGCLNQPFAELKYPNRRASGLTDLRDAILLDGKGDNSTYQRHKEMRELPQSDLAGRFINQMEGLADILIEDTLTLVMQLSKLGQLTWNKEEDIEVFAQLLADGFATVASVYADKPKEQYLNFILYSGINWKRAAKQIVFWTDISSTGYKVWLSQNKIPEGIYEESLYVEIETEKIINFDPIKGLHSDGEQDIGPKNGPLCWVEFERAMHLLYHPILMAEAKARSS